MIILARIIFLSLLLFPFSPAPAQSEEIVEGVVAVMTTHHRGKKAEQVVYLSDLKRYRLFFQHRKEVINREEQLNRVIQHLLLRSEARRFILAEPSKKTIKTWINSIRQRFEDDQDFQLALQKAGILRDELMADIIDYIRVETLIKERIKAFIFITPKAIERYYLEHRDSFSGRKLDEVEPVIQSILRGAKEGLKKREYLGRLKEKTTIKILMKQGDS